LFQLTIFRFSNRNDLDVALLRCILAIRKEKGDDGDKSLKLALKWNRGDIGEEIVKKQGFSVEVSSTASHRTVNGKTI
jgi:hypothetical protein